MPHVYHDAVDAEELLVVRDNVAYLVPEGPVGFFFQGQCGIVHPDGIIGNIVEARPLLIFVPVEAQVSDISPGGLGVIGRPIGKCAGDAGLTLFLCPGIDAGTEVLAALILEDLVRVCRGEFEHPAVFFRRRGKIGEVFGCHHLLEFLELALLEYGVAI